MPAVQEVAQAVAHQDADFKAIFTEWAAFCDKVRAWLKVNEFALSAFNYR
jgi:TRAP-type mannitol/chloroaromatic compound transport system substrate-binding protein